MSKVQDNNNSGLALVLMRNEFYRDNYRRAVVAMLILLLLNVGLIAAIVYKYLNPMQPQYFATTASGRIINIHSLREPVVSDSFVLQWVANNTRAAFSQDYLHWRQQLQSVSGAFTPEGWHYFLQSMKKSNNLKTLVALKMVSNAELTGAPRIVEKAIVDGHFAWKIQMPIMVSYQNKERTIRLPMEVTVIVLRMPVKDYPERIAINNFLPVVQQGSTTL